MSPLLQKRDQFVLFKCGEGLFYCLNYIYLIENDK